MLKNDVSVTSCHFQIRVSPITRLVIKQRAYEGFVA